MSKLPFGFVPIPLKSDGSEPRAHVAAPVYHSGTPGLLSGELRCTMRNLTPLIVANEQYTVDQIDGSRAVKVGNTEMCEVPWVGFTDILVDPGKQVIEPLRTPDGRILLGGKGVKGMIRHSIGALLAAPMERVAEHTYSYRPNLDFPELGKKLLRKPAAAIVVGGAGTPDSPLRIKLLADNHLGRLIFVFDEAVDKLNSTAVAGVQGNTFGVERVSSSRTANDLRRLKANAGTTCDLSGYLHFPYSGGIDGAGHLANLFNDKSGVFMHVLVHKEDYEKANAVDVPDDVVAWHDQETIQHLSSDQEGHLRSSHPLGKRDFKGKKGAIVAGIRASCEAIRKPGHLIFVEYEEGTHSSPPRIVSIGQNYRYRVAYRDTVRTKNGQQRTSVIPLAVERQGEKGPVALSAARGLFGYASDDREGGSGGIGRGDFRQLMGRVSVNFALEIADDPSDNGRFLRHREDCTVPLLILGAPKPSAFEHYLDQAEVAQRPDKARYVSYGETADDVTGELAGRKFYRHQPEAASEQGEALFAFNLSALFERSHDHLLDAVSLKKLLAQRESYTGTQAKLARFVLKPGAIFRFTLRFRDLRPWELGALLVALDPARLTGESTPVNTADPVYAVKLGHGRPLGLGSVMISVDETQLLDRNGRLLPHTSVVQDSLEAFLALQVDGAPAIDKSVKSAWLDLHRYRADGSIRYAGLDDSTRLHRQHSKLRREKRY